MAAGKGGGAWKVAYADFVTAMMAFFLVMWICGQDQKIRKAVSEYFGDPMALKQGMSKSPFRSGALFEDTLRTGTVPQAESVAMGRGRSSYSMQRAASRATKLVSDWLHSDEKLFEYWQGAARAERDAVPVSGPEPKHLNAARDIAVAQLAQRLRAEIRQSFPGEIPPLYSQLMEEAMSVVNWREIAEDLLPQ